MSKTNIQKTIVQTINELRLAKLSLDEIQFQAYERNHENRESLLNQYRDHFSKAESLMESLKR